VSAGPAKGTDGDAPAPWMMARVSEGGIEAELDRVRARTLGRQRGLRFSERWTDAAAGRGR
jgi:hypothetical protein